MSNSPRACSHTNLFAERTLHLARTASRSTLQIKTVRRAASAHKKHACALGCKHNNPQSLAGTHSKIVSARRACCIVQGPQAAVPVAQLKSKQKHSLTQACCPVHNAQLFRTRHQCCSRNCNQTCSHFALSLAPAQVYKPPRP